MTDIRRDWSWSDRYITHIKEIIGPHLLEPAPIEIDQKCATDLVMVRTRNRSIACRVRRATYSTAYLNQFTLRAGRPNGVKTELQKVIEGFGDWALYGFASPTEPGRLAHWNLIDLNAFRAHLIQNPECLITGELTNPDGTKFRFFELTSFPKAPPILIQSSHENQNAILHQRMIGND